MIRPTSKLLFLLALPLLLAGHNAAAQDAQLCAQIREPVDRLRCFDRMFPLDDGSLQTQNVGGAPSAAAEAAEPTDDDDDDGRLLPRLPKDPLFGFSDQEDVASTISAVRVQDKQKMVFMLENEQIWMQSNPRILRIRKGDEVTIKGTLTGGHMLETQDGVRTRVRRIR